MENETSITGIHSPIRYKNQHILFLFAYSLVIKVMIIKGISSGVLFNKNDFNLRTIIENKKTQLSILREFTVIKLFLLILTKLFDKHIHFLNFYYITGLEVKQ